MKRNIPILAPLVLALLVLGTQTVNAGYIYDLNQNGIVDMDDIGRVAAAFGSHRDCCGQFDQRFDSEADLDANERIDMRDLGLIGRQFGLMIHSPNVMPEIPIGTIVGAAVFLVALGVFSLKKPSKHNRHFKSVKL